MEDRARAYLATIEEMGGAAGAITYMQEEIHKAAYRHQLAIESGERPVVGVNVHAEDDGGTPLVQPDYSALEREQRGRLAESRASRDGTAVAAALEGVRSAARSVDNLMPPIILAVKSGATLGEISGTLRDEWGRYEGG